MACLPCADSHAPESSSSPRNVAISRTREQFSRTGQESFCVTSLRRALLLAELVLVIKPRWLWLAVLPLTIPHSGTGKPNHSSTSQRMAGATSRHHNPGDSVKGRLGSGSCACLFSQSGCSAWRNIARRIITFLCILPWVTLQASPTRQYQQNASKQPSWS